MANGFGSFLIRHTPFVFRPLCPPFWRLRLLGFSGRKYWMLVGTCSLTIPTCVTTWHGRRLAFVCFGIYLYFNMVVRSRLIYIYTEFSATQTLISELFALCIW